MGQFADGLDQWIAETEATIHAIPMRYATAMLEAVKAKTPVKTGTLQKGWYINPNGDGTVTLQNDVPYAYLIEYGDRRYAPHKMLELTLQEVLARAA